MVDLATVMSKDNFITAGTVIHSLSNVIVPGYIYCNGQAISRVTYKNLFATIGIQFGTGDGINTFNVPDFQGIALRGTGSQVINTKTYTSPAFASKDKDATAKNGLSVNTVSTPTASLQNANPTHTHPYTDRTPTWVRNNAWSEFADFDALGNLSLSTIIRATSGVGSYNHSHTWNPAVDMPEISTITTFGSPNTTTMPARFAYYFFIKT